jgi:hypothetical protein
MVKADRKRNQGPPVLNATNRCDFSGDVGYGGVLTLEIYEI